MITIRICWWKLVLVLLILANLVLADRLRMVVMEPEQEFIPVYYQNWHQT